MTHPRTTTGLLIGLAVAAALAWRLEGPVAAGVLLGYLLGAALSGLGVAWQCHWLQRQPARLLRAQLEAFLVKLAALTVFALAFRFVGVLAERVDWRAFVVAFAAAVALLLPLGTWETARRLGRRAHGRADGEPLHSRSAL